jgi:formylmethanofuran dehydrogenase subunit E
LISQTACLEQLARLHPRLCPRQVLGVRMGLLAAERLEVDIPRSDKRLLVLVETDGCFADGISVATGCWLGRRSLRMLDYGRVAATVVDTWSSVAVRLRPHPACRTRATSSAGGIADPWHAQLVGYQVMPASELLEVEPVKLTLPLEQLLGSPGVRVICSGCGEEILNRREVATPAGSMCAACLAGTYYALCGALALEPPRTCRPGCQKHD